MAAIYASLVHYKAEISETDADNDDLHMVELEEASRVIDRLCRVAAGWFAPVSATTRTFDVLTSQASRLPIGPLQSVTTLKTDEAGDRTFETTWATTDYRLYPLAGPPYTEVRVDDYQGRYLFPAGQARVQIVGTWGDEVGVVPLPIQRATRLLANRYRVRPNTPEALMAGTNNMMALGAHDPDVMTILRDGGYINVQAVFA